MKRQGNMDNLLKYSAPLRDTRVERNRDHLRKEFGLIAMAAVLCESGF